MFKEIRPKFLKMIDNDKMSEVGGFTLIELLIFCIIIGMLVALFLPCFLDQADKIQQTGTQQDVGATRCSEQADSRKNHIHITPLAELAIILQAATAHSGDWMEKYGRIAGC
ncbi:MAG: hypothetical protein AAGG51_03560 [Cyanobacteria bacterium P01_G01_bin.54]